MKARNVTLMLSLLALMLPAVAGGCGPAPVVVADPVGAAVTPGSDINALPRVPAEDAVQDEVTPTEPAAPTAVVTLMPTADSELSESVVDDEADSATDWPVLRDETYGFEVAYPPTWGFMDLPVYDPGAGGPPTVIERFLILYPAEWEERLKPGGEPDPNVPGYPALSIEVCVGTMEEFRREFMELGGSETVEINGLTALHEWDTYDDYNLIRTVFQHPANDTLRISLTDPVSGFSVRAEENEDIVSLIPVVVSTFRFTE